VQSRSFILTFDKVEYFHRRATDDQHEFTPRGQEGQKTGIGFLGLLRVARTTPVPVE